MEGLGRRIVSEVDVPIHEGITEAMELGALFYFLGEDAAGIIFTSDMEDLERVTLNQFTDIIASEVHVTDLS